MPMDFPDSQDAHSYALHQQQLHQQQFVHQLQQQAGLPGFPGYPIRSQFVDAFYGVSHPDYSDMGPITPDHEDFEGCTEIMTRPRLTKEQVEVLESQFQAHPKPNGQTKRQLAIQTKLTLPRVAVRIAHGRDHLSDFCRTGSKTAGPRPSRCGSRRSLGWHRAQG